VQDIENAPIPPGLTMEQIERAMLSAGAIRNWVVTKVAPGQLQARLNLRSHMALVEIDYDQSSYSIRYKDSKDLKYKFSKRKDTYVIHRNYNSWVQNLNGDIQRTLALLE
jgi:hypothetical protein